MSEIYNRSLITKSPYEDQDFQRAEQQNKAVQGGTRSAIYSDLGLQEQHATRKASKNLLLKGMGLTKKRQEADISIRKEGLAHRKSMDVEGLDMRQDALKYQKEQNKMSTIIGAGNLLLSAGLGYAQWQAEKRVTKEWDLMKGMFQFQKWSNKRDKEYDYGPKGDK